MPNGHEHAVIGGLVGAAFALPFLGELPADEATALLAGAYCGGRIGGQLPDLLEPALHSWHRDFFHSAAVGTALVSPGASALQLARAWLESARVRRLRRTSLPADHPESVTLWVEELAIAFAAGLLIGAIPGYISHLLADIGTPRGVPLLSRAIV